MALARDICRKGRFRGNAEKKQMNSDRGLEDEVFDDLEFGDNRIAGNKFAGNQMAHYVVSQDYLQDVSNNNVEDKVVDQLTEGNSIVIVNDDGGFVIVNDFGNGINNGKVNSIVNNGIVNNSSVNNSSVNIFQNAGDRTANIRKFSLNAKGQEDAAGFGDGASVQSPSGMSMNASHSSKAFPPESSASSSMPALPPPSFGAPPCFDSMQRETGPLCGDSPVGLFSWSWL